MPWEADPPRLLPVLLLVLGVFALIIPALERGPALQNAPAGAAEDANPRQDYPMTSSAAAPQASASQDAPQRPAQRTDALRTRRLLAAAGALAALVTLLTLVPAALGAVSFAVPLVALLAVFASVVALRVSTVRERRARIDAAFAEAMNSERRQLAMVAHLQDDSRLIEERARTRRETVLFDGSAEESEGTGTTTSAAHESETRTAEAPQAEAADGEAASAGARRDEGSTWDPVQVPKPTYLSAPQATRHMPAPVQPEESSTAVPSKVDLTEVLRRRRA